MLSHLRTYALLVSHATLSRQAARTWLGTNRSCDNNCPFPLLSQTSKTGCPFLAMTMLVGRGIECRPAPVVFVRRPGAWRFRGRVMTGYKAGHAAEAGTLLRQASGECSAFQNRLESDIRAMHAADMHRLTYELVSAFRPLAKAATYHSDAGGIHYRSTDQPPCAIRIQASTSILTAYF
jgi:hypothetical protein